MSGAIGIEKGMLLILCSESMWWKVFALIQDFNRFSSIKRDRTSSLNSLLRLHLLKTEVGEVI